MPSEGKDCLAAIPHLLLVMLACFCLTNTLFVSLFSIITLNNFLVFVIFLKHGYCCIHASSLGINKGVHYNSKPKMLTLPDLILKISLMEKDLSQFYYTEILNPCSLLCRFITLLRNKCKINE